MELVPKYLGSVPQKNGKNEAITWFTEEQIIDPARARGRCFDVGLCSAHSSSSSIFYAGGPSMAG